MASGVFDFTAERLESLTDFDRLEARGTLRIALKGAGLDAREVNAAQMSVVVDRVLVGELATRGIDGPDQICRQVLKALEGLGGPADAPQPESPEAIFRRLARS